MQLIRREKLDDGKIEYIEEFLSPRKLHNQRLGHVKRYHPSDDITLIERAYDAANKAHKGQMRRSGEPYIIHPLQVAIILADLEMDQETIAGWFLWTSTMRIARSR